MTYTDTVVITGKPVPFARPGQGRNGKRYTPREYDDWKDTAVQFMRIVNRVKLLTGPVVAYIDVHSDCVKVRIVPDGTAVTFSVANRGRPKGVRGDLDNYVKAVLDAAQDARWIDDDRQVVAVVAQFKQIPRGQEDGR